jgi:peptidoglycan/xylan/chitin deacetylase (PgdA/CDA1 family)
MQLKTFLFKFNFIYNLIPVHFLMRISGRKIIFPFYHYVDKATNENILTNNLYKTKNESEFIKDLRFLKKNFSSISLVDLKNETFRRNRYSFLLSFDDGLLNFHDTVSPILEKEKIFAINFLNTNFIDNRDLFFRYKVNLIINTLKDRKLTDNQEQEILRTLRVKNFDSLKGLILILKSLDYVDIQTIDNLCLILNIDIKNILLDKKPYLTKKLISELLKKGFYFGAHSKTHPYYSEISLENQLLETIESINYLKNEFSIENFAFSFPFSDDKVSLDFFKRLEMNNKDCITFGTAGMKDEQIALKNIQRIPMEYKSSIYSAETIIKGELILYLIKRILRKNIILRK